MAVQITDGVETVAVNTDNELTVAPTRDVAKAGLVGIVAESAPASDPYGTRLVRELEANGDYRLRTVQDRCIYQRIWTATAITHDIQTASTTMTFAYGGLSTGGGLRLNSGASVANATHAQLMTWRTFRMNPESMMYFSASLMWTSVISNATWAWGITSVASLGASLPVSGVLLRRNADQTLNLVVRRNSTDLYVAVIDETGVTAGDYHHIVLGVNNQSAELWIDGLLMAQLTFETTGVPKPIVYVGAANRMYIGQYNEGAVSTSVSLYLAEWSVWESGDGLQITTAEGAAMRGAVVPNLVSAQGSSTGNGWGNSGAAFALTLSNTTSALGATQTGGILTFAAVANGNTDYIIVAYQPDVSGTADGHGTFMITGLNVSAWNTGATNSATIPTTLLFGLAIGSSATSLATVDAAATRMPRRVSVGAIQLPISAAIGQQFDRNIQYTCPNPIPVDSDQMAHVIMRVVSGAATASQVINMNVQLLGYWV